MKTFCWLPACICITPGQRSSLTATTQMVSSGPAPVSCSRSSFHPAKMAMTNCGRDWPWLRALSYVLAQANACWTPVLRAIFELTTMWICASRPGARCPHWSSVSLHNHLTRVDVTAWTKKPPPCFLSPLSDLLATPACLQHPGVKGSVPVWDRMTSQAIYVLSHKVSWTKTHLTQRAVSRDETSILLPDLV